MDYKEKVIALLNSRELSKERKEKLESIFPEVKDSEDERIRKEMIKHINLLKSTTLSDLQEQQYNTWLAWLEKHIYTEEDLDKAYKCADEVQYRKGFEDAKKEVEGQGEQNPTNTVESRFKKGDWIIFAENHNSIYQVEGMDNYRYCLRHYLGGSFSVHFDNELIRAWTIQDAKDGDVLYSPEHNLLWLHKDMEQSYCCINLNYNSNNISFGSDIVIPSDVCPATKEQCDLLFQKIKYEGYEWDANKKELNKIEENPTWSEEDDDDAWLNDIVSKLESGCQLNKSEINWIKSIKNRMHPKQEWNEEDSYNKAWIVETLLGLDGDKMYSESKYNTEK